MSKAIILQTPVVHELSDDENTISRDGVAAGGVVVFGGVMRTCHICDKKLDPEQEYPQITWSAYQEIIEICWDCYDRVKRNDNPDKHGNDIAVREDA